MTIDGLEVRGIAGIGILGWRSSYLSLHNLKLEWIAESAILVANGRTGVDPSIKALTVKNCRINRISAGGATNAIPRPTT